MLDFEAAKGVILGHKLEQVEAFNEMPESHAAVDLANLTTAGLIKACDHFAKIAKLNPVLAESMAEKVVESKKQELEMIQNGMDDKAVKSQKFAAMRDRLRQKTEKKQKAEVKNDISSNSLTIDTDTLQIQDSIIEQRISVAVSVKNIYRITELDKQDEPPELQIDKRALPKVVNNKKLLVLEQTDQQPVTLSESSPRTKPDTEQKTVKIVETVETLETLEQDNVTVQKIAQDALEKIQATEERVITEEPLTPIMLMYAANIVDDQFKYQEFDGVKPDINSVENEIEYDLEPRNLDINEVAEMSISEIELLDIYQELESIILEQIETDDLVYEATDDFSALIYNDNVSSRVFKDFDEFVSTQPIVDKPPKVSEIQAIANDQPLEQTILQVSNALSEVDFELEPDNELKVSIEALQEIIQLSRQNGDGCPILTQEITKQLIRLIHLLGYEKPEEVLYTFVSSRSYVFLWQSIEYIVNIEKKSEQSLGEGTYLAMNIDNDVMSKIVKYIFGLVGASNTSVITAS